MGTARKNRTVLARLAADALSRHIPHPIHALLCSTMASQSASSSGLFSNVFSYVSHEIECFVATAAGNEPPPPTVLVSIFHENAVWGLETGPN